MHIFNFCSKLSSDATVALLLQHLLAVSKEGILNTFFRVLIQCLCSGAVLHLKKSLLSGPVLAG